MRPTKSHVETRTCARCRTKYPTLAEAEACCLFAPAPSGWCAWCGNDLPDRSFCNDACALSYREDIIGSVVGPSCRPPH